MSREKRARPAPPNNDENSVSRHLARAERDLDTAKFARKMGDIDGAAFLLRRATVSIGAAHLLDPCRSFDAWIIYTLD